MTPRNLITVVMTVSATVDSAHGLPIGLGTRRIKPLVGHLQPSRTHWVVWLPESAHH